MPIFWVQHVGFVPVTLTRPEVDSSYSAYDQHPVDEPDEWGDLASWRSAASMS